MKVGSMFAGIGGFDLGFERAGFEVAWCIEWDKHAQAVLRKRFPNAKVYGDIREVDPDALERVDVICGGFPCQDLSVAGKRAGLAGERSGLFHDAMRLVRRLNPSLLVLENVPGLLSSNHGLDFATVLREVGEGWDCEEVAWRVLDSQFFGVAQRRRRVFIVAVGHSRIGCAEEVLALASSGGGHPPAKREARQGSASNAARCPDGGRWWDGSDISASMTTRCHDQFMPDKGNFAAVVQPFSPHGHYRYEASEHAATLQDRENRQGGHTHLVAQAFRKSKRAQSATDDETWVDDGLANTLNGFDTGDARTTHAIAFTQNQRDEVRELGDRAASLSGQGTHQTNYVAIPLQDGRDLAKAQNGLGIGSDGDPSYTLDRTGAQSIAIGMDAEFNARVEQMGTLKRGGEGGTQQCVAIGVDVYNGIETGDVAATVTSATGIANASGPKAIAFNWQNGGGQVAVAFAQNQVGEIRMSETMSTIGTTGNASARTTPKVMVSAESQGSRIRSDDEPSETLRATKRGPYSDFYQSGMVVRRLTPVECERLQGFPDGWTDVGTPEKPTADSHRYKQLGNAVTVNVAEWIARRAHKCLSSR